MIFYVPFERLFWDEQACFKQLTPCPMADMAIGLCGHSSKLRRRARLTSASMCSRRSAEMILGASPPTLPCSLDVPYLMLTMYARPVLGCRVRSACVPVISFVVRIGKDKLSFVEQYFQRLLVQPLLYVQCRITFKGANASLHWWLASNRAPDISFSQYRLDSCGNCTRNRREPFKLANQLSKSP